MSYLWLHNNILNGCADVYTSTFRRFRGLGGSRVVVESARELPPPIFAFLANVSCEQALLGRVLPKELARRLWQTAFLVSFYSVEPPFREIGVG